MGENGYRNVVLNWTGSSLQHSLNSPLQHLRNSPGAGCRLPTFGCWFGTLTPSPCFGLQLTIHRMGYTVPVFEDHGMDPISTAIQHRSGWGTPQCSPSALKRCGPGRLRIQVLDDYDRSESADVAEKRQAKEACIPSWSGALWPSPQEAPLPHLHHAECVFD